MVGLRLLEKLIRLDQSQRFKACVYKRMRKPLMRLIDYLRNIDLDIKNINSISMWIEDIFTKNYDLKRIILSNFHQIYDFRLVVDKIFCHDLFLFEANDTESKKIYNSIFLFSRIAFFFERNIKPQKKNYNFKRMYYSFYSGSIFSKLKENKSYNIDGKESVAAKIKVKIQEKIATIDVEVFLDDFYLVIVHKEDAIEWAKILFLGKHKYIRMKLTDEACIQINTIIDKKTSYILFNNHTRAKHVYAIMKSKKKSAIMRELTVFSENVEALQGLLKRHGSTDSFDILTRNFNHNQYIKASQNKETVSMGREFSNPKHANPSENSTQIVDSSNSSTEQKPKIKNRSSQDLNYNPLHRESKISKFIVPSISNLGDKNKGMKGRFQDDQTISANIQSIGDPNRKSKVDNSMKSRKKDSTFSKNNSSPFRNIFKK